MAEEPRRTRRSARAEPEAQAQEAPQAQAADAPAGDGSGEDEAQYTPQQAIAHSRELADGEPAWLVREALTKAELMGAELLTIGQINDAITNLKQQPVPQAPMPGAASTGAGS